MIVEITVAVTYAGPNTDTLVAHVLDGIEDINGVIASDIVAFEVK